ncbi:MAG TPA: AIR synthase-related protein, partial [Pyrinomonadaceae bacterium]|nr:AIR synthase-related protein [Pyrinomonadaceae bacterium]
VRAATDVTGFALLGHAWEMARASRVTIEIDSAKVPQIPGAFELAAQGLLTSGDKSNRLYVGEDIEISGGVDENLLRLFYDPQTAGGMLISISTDRANELLARLHKTYAHASIIGRVTMRGSHSIVVR